MKMMSLSSPLRDGFRLGANPTILTQLNVRDKQDFLEWRYQYEILENWNPSG